MGRATKDQAARNRQLVIEGAARLFQEHGLKGIAIADLMAQAGLTHGGFYRQFASKDDVAGEACAHSMRRAVAHWRSIAARHPPADRLDAIADSYLTVESSPHPCPMPALAADVAREDAASPVRQAYTGGVAALADVLTACVAEETEAFPRREKALALLAAMVGAVALSRAIDDKIFSAEIMNAVRRLAGGT